MEIVEISPVLINLARKCYVFWSVQVSSSFREKIEDRIDQIEFYRKRHAANRWSSWVSPSSAGFTGWVKPPVELDTPNKG